MIKAGTGRVVLDHLFFKPLGNNTVYQIGVDFKVNFIMDYNLYPISCPISSNLIYNVTQNDKLNKRRKANGGL